MVRDDTVVKISKQVFNEKFLCLLDNLLRYEVVYGGAGSGKSFSLAQRTVLRHMSQPGRNSLIVRKVNKSSRISTFPLIKRVINDWNVGDLFKVWENDMRIRCDNGNEMRFEGLDDVEKLKSVTFETGDLTDIWVEEGTEIAQADFEQLDLRMRGKSKYPFQITLSFNPISELNWINQYFFKRVRDDCLVLQSTYKDNKFIDEAYKKKLEELEQMDKTLYEVYCKGLWGQLSNLIFTNYVIEDFAFEPQNFESVTVGIDWGFGHAAVAELIGIRHGEVYALDEVFATGLTNPEFMALVDRTIGKGYKTTADSAEPARIKEFKQKGYKIAGAKKGPDSVSFGIDWLKRRRIHVHAKRCPNLAREIGEYKWREDKHGNVYNEPVPFNDDCIAAMRYAVEEFIDRKKAGVIWI